MLALAEHGTAERLIAKAADWRSSKMMSVGVSRRFAELLRTTVLLAFQLGLAEMRAEDHVGA
jgi:hypothetical protein